MPACGFLARIIHWTSLAVLSWARELGRGAGEGGAYSLWEGSCQEPLQPIIMEDILVIFLTSMWLCQLAPNHSWYDCHSCDLPARSSHEDLNGILISLTVISNDIYEDARLMYSQLSLPKQLCSGVWKSVCSCLFSRRINVSWLMKHLCHCLCL